MKPVELRYNHPLSKTIGSIVLPDYYGPDTSLELASVYNSDLNQDGSPRVTAEYALLFAAAPELLDACRQFIAATRVGDNYDINNSRFAALQAIAKAEGK